MNAIAASHCPRTTLKGRSPVKPTPQTPALARVTPKYAIWGVSQILIPDPRKMEMKAGERRTEMTVGLVVGIQLIGSSSALALDSSPTLNNLIYSLVAGFTVLLIAGVALIARRKE